MKIVIDIPEVFYKALKKTDEMVSGERNDKTLVSVIFDAVAKGVPLPEHHGRLIDAKDYENSIRKHYFDNSTVIRCTEIALDNAPTIIAESQIKEAYKQVEGYLTECLPIDDPKDKQNMSLEPKSESESEYEME